MRPLLNKIVLAALVWLCVSCSTNPYTSVAKTVTNAVTGNSGGPSLEMKYESEKTKGDKHEENAIKVAQTENKQVATTIVNNQEIPIEFIFLFALGWLMPSPNEIWKGFCNMVRGIFTFWRK